MEKIKGSEVTARRGEEVKRRAKNNVKPVKPRSEFYKTAQWREVRDKEQEEDWDEEDINRILGRSSTETQQTQPNPEAGGQDDIARGEREESPPLYTTVEISTDDESEHQEVGEERQEEEDQRSTTTRAGRRTRKPSRFGEEENVQLSPRERRRRQSRAKFGKYRDQN